MDAVSARLHVRGYPATMTLRVTRDQAHGVIGRSACRHPARQKLRHRHRDDSVFRSRQHTGKDSATGLLPNGVETVRTAEMLIGVVDIRRLDDVHIPRTPTSARVNC